MTRKSTQTAAKTTTSRTQPARQSITFELVARLAPHQGLADNLVRTFGLEPVDYDSIRDATAEHVARAAKAFGTALNEKALQIHLQRITGAFVGSAFGAAQFYGTKKSAAMELTSKLLNDDRDEDRDGPAGFESKAERARLFAAEMALQSFALMAAAEGAIAAYADITGETWKPYEAPAGTRRQRGPQVRRRRDGRFRDGGITATARAEPFAVPPSAGRLRSLFPSDEINAAPALRSAPAPHPGVLLFAGLIRWETYRLSSASCPGLMAVRRASSSRVRCVSRIASSRCIMAPSSSP